MRKAHILLSPLLLPLLLMGEVPRLDELAERDTTTVSSETLELVFGDTANILIFSGSVEVISRDLTIHSDRLLVTLDQQTQADDEGLPKRAIRRIEALGNVSILQADRTARCGKATILPSEGTVTLEDQPEILDGQTRVRGHRIIFHQEDRRVEVQPGPDGQRPEVTLEPASLIP